MNIQTVALPSFTQKQVFVSPPQTMKENTLFMFYVDIQSWVTTFSADVLGTFFQPLDYGFPDVCCLYVVYWTVSVWHFSPVVLSGLRDLFFASQGLPSFQLNQCPAVTVTLILDFILITFFAFKSYFFIILINTIFLLQKCLYQGFK